MIPTIETICEDLAAGKITVQQAIAWMHEYASGAANEARDFFAANAMPECVRVASDQTPLHERGPRLSKLFDNAAVYAYYYADAMLKARVA